MLELPDLPLQQKWERVKFMRNLPKYAIFATIAYFIYKKVK